jgi:hypothetical protein
MDRKNLQLNVVTVDAKASAILSGTSFARLRGIYLTPRYRIVRR